MPRFKKDCTGLCSSPAFLRDHGLLPVYRNDFNGPVYMGPYREKIILDIEKIPPKSCMVCEKTYYECIDWRCPCCKSIMKKKISYPYRKKWDGF
jgi:hypothetical protein